MTSSGAVFKKIGLDLASQVCCSQGMPNRTLVRYAKSARARKFIYQNMDLMKAGLLKSSEAITTGR